MQLSKRLQAVAGMVKKGERVADVGCDHAYVSIYMMEQGIASGVIAMDVNKGPLKRAEENIHKYHLEDRIEIRLSDGIKALRPGEVHTLLIAGMGGPLMQRILAGNPPVLEQITEIILQPQSEIPETRIYLEDIGFEVVEEDMLIDEGKYYVILRAVRKNTVNRMGKDLYYRYGKYLLENKNPYLEQYLKKEKEKLSMIREKLEENPSELNNQKLTQNKKEYTYCQEGLAFYEGKGNN